MLKSLALFLSLVLPVGFAACDDSGRKPKIGVSIGVGSASRWVQEKEVMETRAAELGADIDIRLNTGDTPKTQEEDCIELIDSGVDVLVVTPRNIHDIGRAVDYARQKHVPVISYARIIVGKKIDLFVGYDSERIGQRLGRHLSEKVFRGDYILLRGDPNDHNAALLYNGAMFYINPIREKINVILDAAVPKWSPEAAKEMVLAAVAANGNSVDAILAPNDRIAEACAEALAELKVVKPVVITGMDAELRAVKRILADKQDSTIYMNFKALAKIAVEEAFRMAKKEPVNANAEFENQTDAPVNASLITGELVTRQNIDRVLIDSGYYSREEVYGTP